MKGLLAAIVFATIALAAAAPPTTIPEIEGPRARYQQALAGIHAERDQQLALVNRTYADRLAQLRAKLAGEGDTASAAEVQNEQARLAQAADPTDEERRKMPGLLRVTRTSYEKERSLGLTSAAKKEADANAAWASGLAALEALFVKQADYPKAAAVKAERARTSGEKPVEKPAPAAVADPFLIDKPVAPPAPTPFIAPVSPVTPPPATADAPVAPTAPAAESLEQRVIGTKWLWWAKGNHAIVFGPNGEAHTSHKTPERYSWKVVPGEEAIEGSSPDGTVHKFKMTFEPSFTKGIIFAKEPRSTHIIPKKGD